MSVVTLLPQSGLNSRVSGGLTGQTGQSLSSTTGSNSPSAFVKNGITSPDDTTYWTNTMISVPPSNSHFYLGVDKMTLSPSGLTFKFRGDADAGGTLTLRTLEVWLRKEHNPSLASDIQVASGISLLTINSGVTANFSSALRIIEANRTAFESGIPNNYLCISGLIVMNNSVGSGTYLFNEMELELSGSLPTPWNSFNLYIGGLSESSGNFDLFTFNSENSSGNFDLFTLSHSESSGNFDLYIAGPIETSGNFDLYTLGHLVESGNHDLYIGGHELSSGNFDLYTIGFHVPSGYMNLFMQGALGIPVSGNTVPLFMWSTEGSGLINNFDMVLWNSSLFDPQNAMNMVVSGPGALDKTGSMNLYLENNTLTANQFDLFIANNYLESSGQIPLYINTPEGTENSVPLSGSMNLVIWRDSDNTANWLPMYLQVLESGVSNFPMYIAGETVANSSVQMYIKGIDEPFNNVILYSHGF